MESCGICGTSTSPETKLGGLVICETCLVAEVQTYLELVKNGTIAEALAVSPKAAANA